MNSERSKMNNRFYQKLLSVNGKAKIQNTCISCAHLVALLVTVYFFIHISFTVFSASVYAAEKSKVPSYGSGPVELIIFTDYFCEPCQSLERELEAIQDKLLARGEVKITFVDIPIPGNLSSHIFTKYFLYAAQAETGYVNAIKARKLIFKIARQNSITDDAIEKTFKAEGISFKIFNYKPILVESKILISKHKVNKAPSYILKYPQKEIRKFTDPEQIRKVLLPELQALTQKAKPSPNMTQNNKKMK
jgi:thiol-disulfide isomerase/thioredoxin